MLESRLQPERPHAAYDEIRGELHSISHAGSW